MPKGRDYPVRELRERMSLTQEEFAQRVGTTTRTISRWETGKAKPTRFVIERLETLARQVGATGKAAA